MRLSIIVCAMLMAASGAIAATAPKQKTPSAAKECCEGNPARFNLATYNIRYYSKEDSLAGNTWSRRCPQIAEVVKFHGFDIFGTQEGLKFQLEDLKKQLPGYDYIGIGRDDGKTKGEHSAIFYDTARFDLLDHGDFWLSETPDKPGLGWDAACIRICTWGKFRDKPSGKEFLYFNLHMDHVGKKARLESGKLIERKTREFGSKLPAFLSGDFNVDQTNECYMMLDGSEMFDDSYKKAALRHAPNGTWNDWKPGNFSISRIDHIFVTPQIKVSKYGILTDTYLTAEEEQNLEENHDSYNVNFFPRTVRTPSDHYPVMIEVEIP